ncbi:MAG: arginase [Anaerolineae bacterium]|nr:arginase [Anaerolineae bacterium]
MIEPTNRKVVRILGVPMDLGQQRRGVDMGPSAVRYAGLQERISELDYEVIDMGNLVVPVVEEIANDHSDQHARHLDAVTQVCQELYERTVECMTTSDFSIFLGGDHSMSVGSVTGVASLHKIGVLWVDAHADYNTPTSSPSGNVHGMPVAAILGDEPQPLANIGKPGSKLHPSQMAMIGIRNLDSAERDRLVRSGITVHTMTDIDEHGIALLTRQLISRFKHLDAIHVSLDMDSLDPDFAPGVGTPVPGGLTYREAHLLMELLASSGKVRSMDIVEINPILDNRNRTAELAVELAASLLGQRIM